MGSRPLGIALSSPGLDPRVLHQTLTKLDELRCAVAARVQNVTQARHAFVVRNVMSSHGPASRARRIQGSRVLVLKFGLRPGRPRIQWPYVEHNVRSRRRNDFRCRLGGYDAADGVSR